MSAKLAIRVSVTTGSGPPLLGSAVAAAVAVGLAVAVDVGLAVAVAVGLAVAVPVAVAVAVNSEAVAGSSTVLTLSLAPGAAG